jgi:hypothetical protein
LNPQSMGNLFEVKLQLFTFFLKGFAYQLPNSYAKDSDKFLKKYSII